MVKKINKPEILAPAGDWVSLRAALDAGCDAVYFGVEGMNMRAGAKNFQLSDLKKITKLCHASHVKAYIALNIVVYENELSSVRKIISRAKSACIDAVVCWDLAVIQEAQKQGIPVHMSTQMSVSNSESIHFFNNNFGIGLNR